MLVFKIHLVLKNNMQDALDGRVRGLEGACLFPHSEAESGTPLEDDSQSLPPSPPPWKGK